MKSNLFLLVVLALESEVLYSVQCDFQTSKNHLNNQSITLLLCSSFDAFQRMTFATSATWKKVAKINRHDNVNDKIQ